jgi:hypothetical protein
VVVADTDGDSGEASGDGGAGQTEGEPVRYQVLCRQHHRAGDLGPGEPGPGQLTLGFDTH